MASFFGKLADYLLGDDSVLDIDKILFDNPKKNNFSSIASKATEGILQFPVIISNSIDYDTAVMVSKACERSYASFVKVVFSMNADMSDTGSNNFSDYLQSFHQNVGTKVDTDDSVSNLFEGYSIENSEYKYEIKFESVEPKDCRMTALLLEDMKPYINNFCLTKLNDVYQPKRIGNVATSISLEASKPQYLKGAEAQRITASGKEVFMDSDVKKANELQPTIIRLEVTRSSKKNSEPIRYHVNIGIKATLHMVTSNEYISNLVDACEYKGTLFRFIRWTTGEINFMRDFVLRMDLFAKETKNAVNSTSHWWNSLKKRARNAKISRVSDKRLLPNATFVISSAEVEFIKSNFGFDLMNDKLVGRIMKEYFLLGMIVVDTASEICHIRYDGQERYQLLTFKALEREGGNAERQFKEMLRASKKM